MAEWVARLGDHPFEPRHPTSAKLKAQHVGNVMGCHAGCQEAGSCCTRGGSEEQRASKKVCKRVHPGFETRAHITSSPKQGYQWPHKRDMCPQFFLKKTGSIISTDCLKPYWKLTNHKLSIRWFPSIQVTLQECWQMDFKTNFRLMM